MNNNFKKYIIFWLSQAISQLGSSMTSFALILWAYAKDGKAMTVSLMSFSNYMPYIIVSLLAGTFVDRHRKKKIMLVTDSIAAICSILVFALCSKNLWQIRHIYLVNCIIGSMNAFQGPASAVAIGKIVPKDKLAQISGMISFSNNLVSVMSPMILSRSGGNSAVLGIVNAVMGVGGIVGGIAVSFGKRKRNAVKMIYLSAIFSFQKIPLLNVCNFL